MKTYDRVFSNLFAECKKPKNEHIHRNSLHLKSVLALLEKIKKESQS